MLVDVSSSGNVRGKNKYQYCQSTLACFLSNLDLNMMRMIIKIHRVKTKVVQVSFWLQSYTLFFYMRRPWHGVLDVLGCLRYEQSRVLTWLVPGCITLDTSPNYHCLITSPDNTHKLCTLKLSFATARSEH